MIEAIIIMTLCIRCTLTSSAPFGVSGIVEPSVVILPLVVDLVVVHPVHTVTAGSIFDIHPVTKIVRNSDFGLQGVGRSELRARWLKRLSRRHADEGQKQKARVHG